MLRTYPLFIAVSDAIVRFNSMSIVSYESVGFETSDELQIVNFVTFDSIVLFKVVDRRLLVEEILKFLLLQLQNSGFCL